MNKWKLQCSVVIFSILCHLAITAWGSQSPYVMTTEVPAGVAVRDSIETRIGDLRLQDGVPDKKTAELVYENLDFQRGVQAYLSSLQIASMHGLRRGILEFGPANSTVVMYENLMDSKSLWLTPNTTSVYMSTWLELTDEPVVIETPPHVLGIINDHYFRYVADFGYAGPDKGAGGKFLVVPPGYKGQVPDGFHVIHSKTYGNWIVWRGFQVNGDVTPAIENTKRLFKVYSLSAVNLPPKMDFVDASGRFNNTLNRSDYGFFDEVNEVVQREPAGSGDPEILGLLYAIGIRKGETFAPDSRMKKILAEAADVAAVTARTIAMRSKDDFKLYPGVSAWVTPFPGGSHEFLDNGARVLDARTFMHFYATGITPAMTTKMVGRGSQYGVAFLDVNGDPFDGAKTYKIHLPPDIPAKDFWSLTLYDNQTRSMLQTDQKFPGVDGNKKGLQRNVDGSFDIYIGPSAPAGLESNWLQSIPDKGWNVILRIYGPMQSWFDKSWRPGEPEPITF